MSGLAAAGHHQHRLDQHLAPVMHRHTFPRDRDPRRQRISEADPVGDTRRAGMEADTVPRHPPLFPLNALIARLATTECGDGSLGETTAVGDRPRRRGGALATRARHRGPHAHARRAAPADPLERGRRPVHVAAARRHLDRRGHRPGGRAPRPLLRQPDPHRRGRGSSHRPPAVEPWPLLRPRGGRRSPRRRRRPTARSALRAGALAHPGGRVAGPRQPVWPGHPPVRAARRARGTVRHAVPTPSATAATPTPTTVGWPCPGGSPTSCPSRSP